MTRQSSHITSLLWQRNNHTNESITDFVLTPIVHKTLIYLN
nr:MAG TPA: hypothetical protein [Caudoviricetes sp.]